MIVNDANAGNTTAQLGCYGMSEFIAILCDELVLMLVASFLSSYYEKAVEALYIGPIQTQFGVVFVSGLSFASDFFSLLFARRFH